MAQASAVKTYDAVGNREDKNRGYLLSPPICDRIVPYEK